MTRATRVAVLTPGIDSIEMWRTMATLIKAPEHYRFTVDSDHIQADLSQGLCALTSLSFSPNRVIPESGCDEWCEPDCAVEWCWEPAHHLMATFDTAYSYTADCGCHSGGLHLRLVAELGQWLDQQGARWLWWDESGDGWRHGPDWGTLGDPREACPRHRSIPAPAHSTSGATA